VTANWRAYIADRAITAAHRLRAPSGDLARVPMKGAKEGPFAQFGEDRILDQIFANQAQGYCVEVGAYDGRTGSATYHFEKRGWHCLLVEPIPEFAEEIRRHRRCILKTCAASSREGEATFFMAETLEQMSTLHLAQDHHQWVRRLGGTIKPITVRTTTLNNLLAEARFPELHFVTIDVEGHELEVLQGFDLERYKPRIVIVEELARQSRVMSYMAERGYVNFKRTGVNEWYAHESDTELIEFGAVRKFRRQKRREQTRLAVKTALARFLPTWSKRQLTTVFNTLSRRV
jgi:FkbM family methyltransferase